MKRSFCSYRKLSLIQSLPLTEWDWLPLPPVTHCAAMQNKCKGHSVFLTLLPWITNHYTLKALISLWHFPSIMFNVSLQIFVQQLFYFISVVLKGRLDWLMSESCVKYSVMTEFLLLHWQIKVPCAQRSFHPVWDLFFHWNTCLWYDNSFSVWSNQSGSTVNSILNYQQTLHFCSTNRHHRSMGYSTKDIFSKFKLYALRSKDTA